MCINVDRVTYLSVHQNNMHAFLSADSVSREIIGTCAQCFCGEYVSTPLLIHSLQNFTTATLQGTAEQWKMATARTTGLVTGSSHLLHWHVQSGLACHLSGVMAS